MCSIRFNFSGTASGMATTVPDLSRGVRRA
jgi:hypothetical protein